MRRLSILLAAAWFSLSGWSEPWQGSGTPSSPYLIKTADDLTALSDSANTGTAVDADGNVYTGVYFKLDADITFNGTFTPIVTEVSKRRFAGTIDGDGHTISGLHVTSLQFGGLVGRLGTTGTVKNIKFASPSIDTGSMYDSYAGVAVGYSEGLVTGITVTSGNVVSQNNVAGGIVGTLRQSTGIVDGCSYSGYVMTGNAAAGGIVGQTATNATVRNSKALNINIAMGNTSGNTIAGGIVGQALSGTKIEKCYSTGTLNAPTAAPRRPRPRGATLGGIVGELSASTLESSFSTTTLNGYMSYIGGVVGRAIGSTVSNIYSTGTITDSQYANFAKAGGLVGTVEGLNGPDNVTYSKVDGGWFAGSVSFNSQQTTVLTGLIYEGNTTTNIYFDKNQITAEGDSNGLGFSELTSATGPKGFDASKWVYNAGFYPRIKGVDNNNFAKFTVSNIELADGDTPKRVSKNMNIHVMGDTRAWITDNIGDPLLNGVAGDIKGNQYVLNGKTGTEFITLVSDSTEMEHTYSFDVIPPPPVFLSGEGTEASPYLVKTFADLDSLATITNESQTYDGVYFLQTADIDMGGDTLAPLSESSAYRFNGHYDGGGHKLFNGTIGYNDENNQALITYLGTEGTLKNLTIDASVKVSGNTTLAPFVAYNYGTVSELKNYATVAGNGTVGGIVANNFGTLSESYNAGAISASGQRAGGIAGINNGTINGVQNVGAIKATSSAGGIVGELASGNVTNAANGGTIYADANTGGIVGNYTITGSTQVLSAAVSYGTIFGGSVTSTGSIIGNADDNAITDSTFHNVYYDNQNVPVPAVANTNYAGITGLTTTALTTSTPEGLDAKVWKSGSDSYPVINAFAGEAEATAAAQTYIIFNTGDNTRRIHANANVHSASGVDWKLAQGQFAFNGSTLQFPTLTGLTAIDTLTATAGAYSKTYALKAVAPIPLKGDGTSLSPYVISSADDWNTLAQYVDETEDPLAGKYAAITKDFAFSADKQPVQLGSDPIVGVSTKLLGGSHTISGIAIKTTKGAQALIGTLNDDGSISDLTLEGTIEAGDSAAAFTVVNNGELTNLTNKVNVTSSGYVGGITAFAGPGASFNNCINEGNLSAAQASVGGIVSDLVDRTKTYDVKFTRCINRGHIYSGYAGDTYTQTGGLVSTSMGNNIVFDHCANEGEIVATKVLEVGGLIGNSLNRRRLLDRDYPQDTVRFISCYNSGKIYAAEDVGGLYGYCNSASNVDAYGILMKTVIIANDCYNKGDIIVNPDSISYVTEPGTGGLFAVLNPGSIITNCQNYGSVSGIGAVRTDSNDPNRRTAGIAGLTFPSSVDYPIVIENCTNYGKITGTQYSAGLLGVLNSYVHLNNSANYGVVNGTMGVGGIAAQAYENSYLLNIINGADVKGEGYVAGGVGNTGGGNYFTNVANLGNITGTSGIGGIVGHATATLSNCYNMGTIRGGWWVGGICGDPSWTQRPWDRALFYFALYNSYNAGHVEADSTSLASSLVGVTDGAWTWRLNKALSSYYVTDYGTFASDSLGTGVTIAELAKNSTMKPFSEVLPNVERGYTNLEDSLSAGWNYGDEYTLPLIKTLEDNDMAKLYAAAVVLADGDRLDSVTTDFHVGTPNGLTWKSSDPAVTISGNDATVADGAEGKTVELTATCGDYSRVVIVKIAKKRTGTGIQNVRFQNQNDEDAPAYNIAGQRVGNNYRGIVIKGGKKTILK